MRELIADLHRLRSAGEPVGRAVVTSVWGSAPRAAGACMLATAGGKIAGSVSGGCVESATAQEISAAIAAGQARTVEFGVSDEAAWEVGLACGGTIRVLVEPAVRDELVRALESDSGVVLVTAVDGMDPVGAGMIVREDGAIEGPLAPAGWQDDSPPSLTALEDVREQIADLAGDALKRGLSRVESLDTGATSTISLFLEVHPRRPKLVIFGGVHVAGALVPMAKELGFCTIVADGREAFLTRARFPDADELVLGWPDEAFEQIGLDHATHVCILTHDPKFDDPALEIALRSDAAYVGAIGSRKTQAARRERLRDAGLTDEQLDRLHGPIGLDLGGHQPGEIAVAILAEIVATRHRGSAPPKSRG